MILNHTKSAELRRIELGSPIQGFLCVGVLPRVAWSYETFADAVASATLLMVGGRLLPRVKTLGYRIPSHPRLGKAQRNSKSGYFCDSKCTAQIKIVCTVALTCTTRAWFMSHRVTASGKKSRSIVPIEKNFQPCKFTYPSSVSPEP